MPEERSGKKISLKLKKEPKTDDIIDGKTFSWWDDRLNSLRERCSCIGENEECRERYNDHVDCFHNLLKALIHVRWVNLNPDVIKDNSDDPPERNPLDYKILTSLERCSKCNNIYLPLFKLDSRSPQCCFYCGHDKLIEGVKILQDDITIVRTENYSLPPPPEFVDKNDMVFVQPSGVISLTKMEDTYAEGYIEGGYEIGQECGIPLSTDHEAALLKLLHQQSREVYRMEENGSRNEYIVKNQIEIVIECKQIEAFEKGVIKENPDNPNTLVNALERALGQHSRSDCSHLPLLVHLWIKYQNRFPFLGRENIIHTTISSLANELPENVFLIVTTGLLTDKNYCDIFYDTSNVYVKSGSIIETIEKIVLSNQ